MADRVSIRTQPTGFNGPNLCHLNALFGVLAPNLNLPRPRLATGYKAQSLALECKNVVLMRFKGQQEQHDNVP